MPKYSIKRRNKIVVDQWGEPFLEGFYPSTEELAKKQVPGIVRLLNLKKPIQILDCPCGWGRHSNLLAKLGHKVIGIDITKRFIEMARAKAPKDNPPTFKVADMRKLKMNEEYDVILNLRGSFGYFDRYTDFRVLKSFVKGLRPNGQLMIDQFNRERLVRLPPTVWFKLPGGKLFLIKQSFDLTKGTYSVEYIVVTGRRERIMRMTINWYTVAEYRAMFERLGMKRLRFYGDFDGSEYTLESNQQIVIATKE